MRERIKSCFKTPKRAALSIVCIVAVIAALGTGTAFAATNVAKSTAIGEVNAKNYAFADAGVDPASAENVFVEFDYEAGQFVYEIEFVANGTEYEYWIKASDGSVVKRESEIVSLEAASTATAADAAAITEDEAKKLVLSDAGIASDAVTYTKVALDYDDGILVYDVEFYTADTEYEYEVNASTGTIYSKSKEPFAADSAGSADSDSSSSTASGNSSSASRSSAASSSGSTASAGNASDTGSGSTSSTSSSYISVDEAKSIALCRVGLSASDVTFTKAKLDKDDGIMEYEIEFYQGRTEYEVTINASTGAVIDYDVDYDD